MDESGAESMEELHFFYDAQSRPTFVKWNNAMYRYVHSLQGDIVGIVDAAGNLVVEYRYDAWGKPLSITGTLKTSLGRLNPFRYRGYVYDGELGLYYLRSRYYSQVNMRFLNTDRIISLISKTKTHNVFSYCDGNPLCYYGNEGTSAVDVVMQQGQSFTNIDGPYPFADIVYIFALIGAYVYDSLANTKGSSVAKSSYSSASRGGASSKTVAEELKDIAGVYGNFKCVDAKDAMLEYLLSQNLHGTVISLRFPYGRGFVYSNSRDQIISQNGFHVGVEYEGYVYCNVHPAGMAESLWIMDFEDPFGFCKPEDITRIEF